VVVVFCGGWVSVLLCLGLLKAEHGDMDTGKTENEGLRRAEVMGYNCIFGGVLAREGLYDIYI
jgi:hypothetical protein